ncbi:MAG: DUF4091 domain-containing protein [Clostridiales bacterium]|nr:DUF4091 domain-containing protein [Candidatus Equinaster intestinalis]
MLKTVAASSLQRIFPNECPKEIKKIEGLKNEPVSFQIAFRYEENKTTRIFIDAVSDLPISCYNIGFVPVAHVGGHTPKKSHGADLYPDILYPVSAKSKPNERNPLFACGDSWYSLFITVNESGKMLKPGKHTVTVTFYEDDFTKKLSVCKTEVNIIDAALPKQSLIYTNWLHCDCIADYYGIEVYSERFFSILGSFVSAAAKNGMNMVLLPAFTPPLDTPVGKTRKNVQLVKITEIGEKYEFDFSLMKRFIGVCKKAGINKFEHAHLFSQWGAKATPAIYAAVGGKEKRIFGWDTKATSKKYKSFLEQYIPALKEFLRQEKLEKNILFHISDEPEKRNEETFAAAVKIAEKLLDGFAVGDAVSEYRFYENGLIKLPIAALEKADEFYGRCDNFWLYYTGLQKGSNRLFACSPEQNRSIGFVLYRYGAKGFLHWGLNYYYDVLSSRLFNPFAETTGHVGSAGTSYCVYPSLYGTALQSVRQKVFYEGLLDMRALELLEKYAGKKVCLTLLKKHFGEVGTESYAETPEQMLSFRQDLNKQISKYLKAAQR